jgi:KUP system potassium uptake protein
MKESRTSLTSEPSPAGMDGSQLAALGLGVLGVVYGDIGTSPLYAFHQCLGGASPMPVTGVNVPGVASPIFWARVIVVSIHYVPFLLRADNEEEASSSFRRPMSPLRETSFTSRKILIGH